VKEDTDSLSNPKKTNVLKKAAKKSKSTNRALTKAHKIIKPIAAIGFEFTTHREHRVPESGNQQNSLCPPCPLCEFFSKSALPQK